MAERTWDKYEAALLIDTYNSVDSGAFKRDIAVAILSNSLRKRAENLGLIIDSKYRNNNGVSMMLSTLVYLFSNGTKKTFKLPNAVFQQVYKIYKSNREEYSLMLYEAKKQCSDDFDTASLSMEQFKSIFSCKIIGGMKFDIENNIELLRLRYIEYCHSKKQKGSLVWIENGDLVYWLNMLDSRLKNIKVITNSIFDALDFERFREYKRSNNLGEVLKPLVGQYNVDKFSQYLDIFFDYVDTLSEDDKSFLGFSSIGKTHIDEAHNEHQYRNAPKSSVIMVYGNATSSNVVMKDKQDSVVGKDAKESNKLYQNNKDSFLSYCKDSYGIGYIIANENFSLLLKLEEKLIEERIIDFGLFDPRDFNKLQSFFKGSTFKSTLTSYFAKKFINRVSFYFEILLELLNNSYINTVVDDVSETGDKEHKDTGLVSVALNTENENIDNTKAIIEFVQDIEIEKAIVDKEDEQTKLDTSMQPAHDISSIQPCVANEIVTMPKNEERFAAWLAQNIPSSNLQELHSYYEEVTNFCIRINVLKKSLLETMQLSVVKRVQKVVSENRPFKVTHKKNLRKIIAAVQYYTNYIKTLGTEPREIELPIDSTDPLPIVPNENVAQVIERANTVANANTVEEINTDKEANTSEERNVIEEDNAIATTSDNYLIIDFNTNNDLAYTFPIELKYFQKTIHIEPKWRSVYIVLLKLLYDEFPSLIPVGRSFTGNGRMDFGNSEQSRYMVAPKLVINDMYLETNLSAKDIVCKIKALLDICHVKYSDVVIKYNYKANNSLGKNQKEQQTVEPNAAIVQGSLFDQKGTQIEKSLFINKAKDEDTLDLLLETIRNDNVEYADKRSKGGCLWVAVSKFNEEYIEKLRDIGAKFKFAPCSGALGLRDGWWTYDIINKINKEPDSPPDPVPVDDSDELNDSFISMLKKYYSKGFRIGSGLEVKKFKSQWQSEYNKDAPDDSTINRIIDEMTITIGKKAYLPEVLLPVQIKEKIFGYIRESFANDNHMIYYEALYNHFSQDLLNSHINNSDMLEAYLRRTNYENHFYLRDKYFSDIKTSELNPTEAVRKYLVESGRPVNVTQIYSDLSQISNGEIYKILTGIDSREFINNQKGEFFHVSIVDLSANEIENIKGIIDGGIYNKGFISGLDLWNQLNKKYPDLVAQYPFLTDLGMRSVLAFHFGTIYDFKGTIISKKGESLKAADVYRTFAQHNTEFTIEDLLTLSAELNTGVYYDEVYNYAIRINSDKFITRDNMNFDIEAIDNILEDLCKSDYASLDALTIFSGFPYCGYTWNVWLLESFVARYSNKFTLLHANFNATKCVGAIVKLHTGINTFDELLTKALADSNVPLSNNMSDNISESLGFFVKNGFLARKSYSTIEDIVKNAIKLRLQ